MKRFFIRENDKKHKTKDNERKTKKTQDDLKLLRCKSNEYWEHTLSSEVSDRFSFGSLGVKNENV